MPLENIGKSIQKSFILSSELKESDLDRDFVKDCEKNFKQNDSVAIFSIFRFFSILFNDNADNTNKQIFEYKQTK